jgi:hypothetical protein
VRVLRGVGIALDKLLDAVSLVDEFRDEVLAFLALDGLHVSQDGGSEKGKNLHFLFVEELETRSAVFESLLDGSGPDDLGCKDDDLGGVFRNVILEVLLVEVGGVEELGEISHTLRK